MIAAAMLTSSVAMINLRPEADDYQRAQRRHDDCGAEGDDAVSEDDYEDDQSRM